MKYARIDIETIGFANHTDKAHINFGDQFQNIILKDLYKKMGIPDEEIYVLDFNEISSYGGEYLVLPVNQAISHNVAEFFSPKIIPVFLGISRDTSVITELEKNYYRRFAPIGCRDEAIYTFLRNNCIDCYLNGCITITADRRRCQPEDGRVYLIEVPKFLLDTMPESIRDSAVYLENVFYGSYEELVKDSSLEEYVRNRYGMLKEDAKLVVTSRMHIAAPCIGMGIPVILARNTIDYRLSWIDKYIPIYTKKNISEINWNPQPVEGIEDVKEMITRFAIKQIRSMFKNFSQMTEISEFYEQRDRVEYKVPQFSQKVIDYIASRWTGEEYWRYAIWGENDASERLYQFLTKNYPRAEFCAFNDSYKTKDYHGRKAQKPCEIAADDSAFIFVTGYTAADAARERFDLIGRDPSSYFLFDCVIRDGY